MAELKINFQAVRVRNSEEAMEQGFGAFFFLNDYTTLWAVMPNKRHHPTLVRFNIGDQNKTPFWEWNGNKDKPTLHPSLHWPGHWHGYLKDGMFESV